METALMAKQHKCGREIKASDDYCAGCGERVNKQIRSENEIRAMLASIKKAMDERTSQDKKDDGMFSLMMFLPINVALEWVMGGKNTPLSLISKEEREKSSND